MFIYDTIRYDTIQLYCQPKAEILCTSLGSSFKNIQTYIRLIPPTNIHETLPQMTNSKKETKKTYVTTVHDINIHTDRVLEMYIPAINIALGLM